MCFPIVARHLVKLPADFRSAVHKLCWPFKNQIENQQCEAIQTNTQNSAPRALAPTSVGVGICIGNGVFGDLRPVFSFWGSGVQGLLALFFAQIQQYGSPHPNEHGIYKGDVRRLYFFLLKKAISVPCYFCYLRREHWGHPLWSPRSCNP